MLNQIKPTRLTQVCLWSWITVAAACGSQTPVSVEPESDSNSITAAVVSRTPGADEGDTSTLRGQLCGQRTFLNVAYQTLPGVDPNLLSLDVYLPEDTACNRPIVVWVHGGGWKQGDKSQKIENKRSLFNEAGYILVSVNYRLSPDPLEIFNPFRIKYPIHPQDVATALDFIHSQATAVGGDPNRIALLGHSAGGGIVALLGTDESFLQAVGHDLNLLQCVGSFDTEAYDIPTQLETGTINSQLLYINAFGWDPEVLTEASPMTHVEPGKGIPPFLLVSRGNQDRRAMVSNFAQTLETSGSDTTIIDASSLSHEEVNSNIGKPRDTIMTPPLMNFLSSCFGR